MIGFETALDGTRGESIKYRFLAFVAEAAPYVVVGSGIFTHTPLPLLCIETLASFGVKASYEHVVSLRHRFNDRLSREGVINKAQR